MDKMVKLFEFVRKWYSRNLVGTIYLRRKKDVVTKLLQDKQYVILMRLCINQDAYDSVTEENVEQIMKEKSDTEQALDALKRYGENVVERIGPS